MEYTKKQNPSDAIKRDVAMVSNSTGSNVFNRLGARVAIVGMTVGCNVGSKELVGELVAIIKASLALPFLRTTHADFRSEYNTRCGCPNGR